MNMSNNYMFKIFLQNILEISLKKDHEDLTFALPHCKLYELLA